jgi:hypothetical protein
MRIGYTTKRACYVLGLVLPLVFGQLANAEEDGIVAAELHRDTPADGASTSIRTASLVLKFTVCQPLREAQSILATLQAPPYAHLEGKASSTITPFANKGWADGLGWGNEVCSGGTHNIVVGRLADSYRGHYLPHSVSCHG